jgi:hypothetical protein
MKLSIALATRRRPGILVRTVNQTLSNITNPDTRLVILADDDDDGTISVQAQLTDPRIIWSIAPRPDSVGEKYNRVIKVCPADVYMVHVDYAPQVTKGFDERVIEAATVYPDGYAIILGHLANLSFSSINAVTHKMAKLSAAFTPNISPTGSSITGWRTWPARSAGRCSSMPWWTARESKSPSARQSRISGAALFDWLHFERRQIAESIINSVDFDETPARKRRADQEFYAGR